MLDNSNITNTDELTFAVFCIENIAIRLGKKAKEVYQVIIPGLWRTLVAVQLTLAAL